MSTETTEFLTFPCTEAVRKQPEASFKPGAAILRGVPGLISIYAGPAVEDETKAFVFTRWASLQAHIDFTKSPRFERLEEALGPLLAGPPVVEHVDFGTNFAECLAAPITEIARFTLKEGHTKEQLALLLDQMRQVLASISEAQTFGWCMENKDQAVAIIGWKSPEAHKEAAEKGSEDIRELLGQLQEHADVTVIHAKLVAL